MPGSRKGGKGAALEDEGQKVIKRSKSSANVKGGGSGVGKERVKKRGGILEGSGVEEEKRGRKGAGQRDPFEHRRSKKRL